MNKFLASLAALFGFSGAGRAQQKIESIDPDAILFTTPTLSNETAPLESVAQEPGKTDFVLHEDEWTQVEFLAKSQLGEVQHLLTEYKRFEQTHRAQQGWRDVYVRNVERAPIVSGNQPLQRLEGLLGVKAGPAPMLFSSDEVTGRVTNGFSLPLGGDVTLYGYQSDQGIPVLGASLGAESDAIELTEAFTKLSANLGLLLVDWRAQCVLVCVGASGQIEVWRP